MEAYKYTQLETDIIMGALDLAKRKRPAYTGDDKDVLINFKKAGNKAGITPKQAWIILANKHWDALVSHALNPKTLQAEPLIERAKDVINYVILLMGLAIDDGDIDYEFEFKASPYSKEGRENGD